MDSPPSWSAPFRSSSLFVLSYTIPVPIYSTLDRSISMGPALKLTRWYVESRMCIYSKIWFIELPIPVDTFYPAIYYRCHQRSAVSHATDTRLTTPCDDCISKRDYICASQPDDWCPVMRSAYSLESSPMIESLTTVTSIFIFHY
jgi:hypothetical protein